MVYILSAFFGEVKEIIDSYELKKIEGAKFVVFEGEELTLVISGQDLVNAAAAVGFLGGYYGFAPEDIIINFGICGADSSSNEAKKIEHGDVIIVNKIIERETKKTFYPDMLFENDFCECCLVSAMAPMTKQTFALGKEQGKNVVNDDNGPIIYDMEAAAIYQAASNFVGPHQMAFVKVVSDFGEKIGLQDVRNVVSASFNQVKSFIDRCISISKDNDMSQLKLINEKTDQVIEKLSVDMKCSKTMTDLLRQLIKYQVMEKTNYEEVIDDMYKEGWLPCKSKKEGKVCLENLKQRLL